MSEQNKVEASAPSSLTIGEARQKVRQAFQRQWDGHYPPAVKRQAEEDALDALIQVASRGQQVVD